MDMQEKKVYTYQLPARMRGSHASTKFQNAQILTNFYPVEIKQFDQIHIFRLKFTPPIQMDDRATRQKILQQVGPEISKNIREPIYSGFNIYSINQPINKQFTVKTQSHQVSIKQVKILNVKSNPNILVQFLNNGLRNLMQKLNYIQLGKGGKFFNTKKKDNIENLVMYSGFQANFMQLEKGIYLRVDTAKKIVRNQTVLQFIDEFYRSNATKDRDEKRTYLKQQLINKVIMTNYGRPRYIRIVDLQFAELNTIIIPGQNIPILDYYAKKYNLKIQNYRQPLLVVQQRRKKEQKTYMLPELCLMTGIPDDFDEFRRKKISQATIKSAEQRKNDISVLMNEIKDTSEINSLKEIGIKVSRQMESFTAKIIPAPRLRLGRDDRIQPGKQSFFNLFSQPIFSSKHSIKLGIISFRSASLGELMDVFESTSKKLQISLKMVKVSAGQFDSRDSRRALKQIQKSIYEAAQKQQCNICLVVIPNYLKSQYKKVKQICLLQNKIVCQIATEGTLKKNGFRSIGTKILLQLIAKRGNTLWVPDSALKIDNVMLMAFDNGKCKNKNILAGVATVNSTFSSICSKFEQYNDLNGKMQSTYSVIIKLIDAYVSRNKIPPKQVIIFANSCSNDQINLYNEYMLQPTIKKLQQIYNTAKPSLTLILVNTKTSQRFFQSQGGSIRNVPAGTIVSSNIVSKNYDFFMVSQFTTRGSTVPNHYKVIYTDSKIQEGILQELIYSQCFNYVNWTGSIKVPGILQYAKKCAKFSTQVLQTKKVCEQLESKLYFI